MAFVRVKSKSSSKGEKTYYAYLVENRWHKRLKQPKQRVKQYLGRVYKCEKRPTDFFEFIKEGGIECIKGSYEDFVKGLVLWELFQHNIKDSEVDFAGMTVRRQKRAAVLAMNEGHLCDYTLKQLLLVRRSDDEREGYSLAKALVEAGIAVPKELFVMLYEKVRD